jgi:prepilin-type N-terminal cleavage/methylation domain-containing protein
MTLIELLVVMSLIAVLAALAVAFLPSAASTAKEARAAQQVQGWLNIAKQRAMRDQAPRGLRLFITNYPVGATTLNLAVTDCQYIEQPDDFPANAGVTMVCPPQIPLAPAFNAIKYNCVQIINTDLTNGYPITTGTSADPNAPYWTVQPGDYLEVTGTGLMHRIRQVGALDAANNPRPDMIVVDPQVIDPQIVALPPVMPIGPTSNFRIVRAPRVAGEETLKMPDGTIIDLQTNVTYGNALSSPNPTYYDVLFSPSGEVISPPMASSNINLWVRMPNTDFPTDVFRGDPTIVSIFTKTGFVGAFPPVPGGPNPYSLVR